MSNRYEWAHASAGFEVLDPDDVEDESPDGNAAGDYAIAFGEGVMLYGSPAALRTLLLRAHNALPPGGEYVPTGTSELRSRPGR